MDELMKLASHIIGGGLAAWLAIRVEIRWLRADVNRAHSRLDHVDNRIHELEVR